MTASRSMTGQSSIRAPTPTSRAPHGPPTPCKSSAKQGAQRCAAVGGTGITRHEMTRHVAALLTVAAIAVVGSGAAAAATAPSATTGPVNSVGPTTATITGSVNPNGTATSWQFEYGTSTNYGSVTTAGNAGSGTSSVPVSFALTGLKAGTTYHYRLVATSTAGTTRGADGILTTSAAPQV